MGVGVYGSGDDVVDNAAPHDNDEGSYGEALFVNISCRLSFSLSFSLENMGVVGVYGSGDVDVVDNAPHDNDEGSYGGALFVNVSCCLSLFFFSLENMGVGVYGDISVMDNALHDNDEGSYGGSIFLVVSLSLHVLHIFFSYLSWCKNCLRKNIGVVVMSWTMPPRQ